MQKTPTSSCPGAKRPAVARHVHRCARSPLLALITLIVILVLVFFTRFGCIEVLGRGRHARSPGRVARIDREIPFVARINRQGWCWWAWIMGFIGLQKRIKVLAPDTILPAEAIGFQFAGLDPALNGPWAELEKGGQLRGGIEGAGFQDRGHDDLQRQYVPRDAT